MNYVLDASVAVKWCCLNLIRRMLCGCEMRIAKAFIALLRQIAFPWKLLMHSRARSEKSCSSNQRL